MFVFWSCQLFAWHLFQAHLLHSYLQNPSEIDHIILNDSERQKVMRWLLFGPILTTFEESTVFLGCWVSIENRLEPKTKPLPGICNFVQIRETLCTKTLSTAKLSALRKSILSKITSSIAIILWNWTSNQIPKELIDSHRLAKKLIHRFSK